jgi:predicted ester cyclase
MANTARSSPLPASQVRRLVEEACNTGHLAVLDDILAVTGAPEALPGAAHLRRLLAAFRAAVPDACWTIDELVAAGETVVTRLTVHGTFSGSLLGLAPPGRPASVSGVAISRFAAGRLVEIWLQADLLGLLQQLEVFPPLSLTQAVVMARLLRTSTLLTAPLQHSDTSTRFHPP